MTLSCHQPSLPRPRWMKGVLVAAGIYNLLFGLWAVGWPHLWFQWSGLASPVHPMLWQCIGMIVGVYGIGYLVASRNPLRHWPIVLVGFLGKLFGPIGFAWSIAQGSLPLSAAWITILNDLVWLVPFAMILWAALLVHAAHPTTRATAYTVEEAAGKYRLSDDETLLEASRNQTLTLVFLRHFGCTFTRRILRHLEELEAESKTHGARLVLVHMLHKGDENTYLHGGSVARIADPDCELYRAFGLGKGGFRELLGPTVWVKGFLTFFSGCGVGHLAGDGLQMPGAFLFRNGKTIAARPAKTAAELPDIDGLFKACTHPDALKQ